MAYGPVPSTADTTEITADSTEVTVDRADVRTAETYTARITPWQANPVKAKFLATVQANVQPYADSQAVISNLPLAFDLDYAEGAQLDVVGQWVGLSRNVPAPLPNVFFSIGSDLLGLGRGYIKGPFDSGQGISLLPDDLYCRLIRAKIAANAWDGTADGLLITLRTYFTDPSTRIIVDDGAPSVEPVRYFSIGDASRGLGIGVVKNAFSSLPPSLGYGLKIGFAGKIPSQIDLAILSAKLIPIKAMGSNVATIVTTVDQTPLFGIGVQNANVAGLGSGAIGAAPGRVSDAINNAIVSGNAIDAANASMDSGQSIS